MLGNFLPLHPPTATLLQASNEKEDDVKKWFSMMARGDYSQFQQKWSNYQIVVAN
jgi:hypothetical protein